MEITKRVDLNLGYSCNIKCRFCYYQERMCQGKKYKDMTTREAKAKLDYIRVQGKTAVDLTGGEPTIRPDLPELIEYAKKIGFETVCVITNGLKMSDKSYAALLVEKGLNDVLFSMHGHTPELHDYLTRVPGSYQSLRKAIDNVRSLGIHYRNNCVVNGLNYKHIPVHAALLNELGFKTINYIMFNPIIDAGQSADEMYVPYSEASPYLKKMIDEQKGNIPKITVRYIPLCLMKGYESYVTHMAQIQYDPDEWDYVVRHNTREGRLITFGASLFGMCLLSRQRIMEADFYTLLRDGLKRFFAMRSCVKSDACKTCAYDYICYGLWKQYAKKQGTGELTPVQGPKEHTPYCKRMPK